jgi:hypothetical protein
MTTTAAKCTVLIALSTTACSLETQPLEHDPYAFVSDRNADRAFEIVDGLDYIPFSYSQAGCASRSLYTAMELAANGIPTTALYLFGDLEPNDGVSWGYHVAPLLKPESAAEPLAIDPTLSDAPVPVSKWVELNNPQGEHYYDLRQGSVYISTVFGRINRVEALDWTTMISSFEQMRPFWRGDILDACEQLDELLQTSGGRDAQQRRERLLERTGQLFAALAAVGKLDPPEVPTEFVCRRP